MAPPSGKLMEIVLFEVLVLKVPRGVCWPMICAPKTTVFRHEYCSLVYNVTLPNVHKNTERHTAHTIVSWPNPKQWVIVHTSDLMIITRQSIYILSTITREMGQLKTHSPTCFVMDNWENVSYLTHTLDKLYLTGILWVQCLQKSLHSDDNEMVLCTNKRIRSSSQNVSDYLHSS